ncbi:hypothetical protein JRQ81_016966, partial [Phrynocephalus forsythii]
MAWGQIRLSEAEKSWRQLTSCAFYNLADKKNNTVWKLDSCQECRCHGDITLCEALVCKNPRCNFRKGERLRISPNACCPECVPQMEGFCKHEGQIYEHGAKWAGVGCTSCSCVRGEVVCTRKPCPGISCETGEVLTTSQGACCPQCVGSGETCSFDGQMFQDAEEWHPNHCAKCVCRNGTVECFAAFCEPLLCNEDENTFVPAGKCCPECVPKSCSVSRRSYEHGEQWMQDACTTCLCERGEAKCLRHTCSPLTCQKEENKVQRPGKCCEECVSSKQSCVHNGTLRYHDEMWSGPSCEFCVCQEGQVACWNGECANVECALGEELIHLEGKCCPECISRGGPCVYKEHTKDSGEKWKEGLCRECECLDSEVLCFSSSCPTCPKGSVALAMPGECCPQCQPGQCHSDCLTCSKSFDLCDTCRDAAKQLQNGRCVDSCGPGFYQEAGRCLACEKTCSTCRDGYVCTSCKDLLHLKDGRCEASCGEGYFPGPLKCIACHESCATCWGPTAYNCSSCKEPSHVLLEGFCVASCGQGFYIKDGVCKACHEDCEACYPDRPGCIRCAAGRVLHGEHCVLECPSSYYADSAQRCRACHKSCAACAGPLSTQCTSCSFPLALRQAQCLAACGEGFYQDHTICRGCHSSCRECVGPEYFHCTRCMKLEEGLQPEMNLEGTSVGICLPQCKPQFYLNKDGLCKECYASCLSCTEEFSRNCTACVSPGILHEGKCLSECPEGWYHREDHCYACHPSCKTCHGPSEADCVTCQPHAPFANGRCRTPCKQGKYLNLVGYCVDCHPSCSSCVADLKDRGSICLKCQNFDQLLLKDHCVIECPAGYYKVDGMCQACHPSCKTCEGGGPLTCTSCDSNLVLSHMGSCTSSCFLGFYKDKNLHCKPCSSPCLSCDSGARCTSCRDPSKVLLFGECQDNCAPQYYLDFPTKTCKECDWSCNACDGPRNTDCSQCMDGYVLQDGACAGRCPPAFYRAFDRCERCDDKHCLQCQAAGACTHCEAPFFLLGSQCVSACGNRFYEDRGEQKCSACPNGCLECDGSSVCLVCDSAVFLHEGHCISHCGHGFYGNPRSRECERVTNTLVLKANGSLWVGIGGTKPLVFSFLEVSGLGGSTEDLLFHVVDPPTNGRLVTVANAKKTELSQGDRFTGEDVKGQRVLFEHDKKKSRNGRFSLKISHQEALSEPELFTVQAFSTQAPYVLRNEGLLLNRGETGSITDLLIDIRDNDNPQDVTVAILDSPHHGQFIKRVGDTQSVIHQFHLQDLSSGIVQYIHDGSNSIEDTVVLQVRDGYHFQNILFHIKITPKSDGVPRLVTSPMVWVPEGGMLQITNRILQAEMPGVSDSALIYTISDQPRYGEVVFLIPMPADDPGFIWRPLPDGRAASPTTTFTQQDINEGVIWYQHSGSETESDSLRFQAGSSSLCYSGLVSAASSPQAHLETHLLNIAILPHSLGAPMHSLGSSFHMTALDDRVTPIEPHHLSFVNSESPMEEIVYNVTVPLAPNQGKMMARKKILLSRFVYCIIEHRDKPQSPVKYFTQADIASGKIAYRPPAAAPHMREMMEFSFAGWFLPMTCSLSPPLVVSDGERTSPEMVFTIHLLSSGEQSPLFQITPPILKVSQGGRATIGIRLTVGSVDRIPEDIFFEVVEPPHHGALLKHGSGFPQHLREGDTFTYEEITHNALQYIHDGSSTAEDRMEISVTDGLTSATVVLKVEVTPRENDGPQLDPSCPLAITVAGKTSVTITRSHFAYTDNNSPDSKIRIQLISLPIYGTLVRMIPRRPSEFSEVYNFTMEDINNQRIRYITEFETIHQPVRDIFHFNVFDADDNRL